MLLKLSAHDRLGYESRRRLRRRRNYDDGYGRAWSRWYYSNGYQPSYDSSDNDWVDYDNPEEYSVYDSPKDYSIYGWRPRTYSGFPRTYLIIL